MSGAKLFLLSLFLVVNLLVERVSGEGADQGQSEKFIRILVPNYDSLLQTKLNSRPEYQILIPKNDTESDTLIRSHLSLYLQLQDEIFREAGLSAVLSEVIQTMIKVGFVSPTEREIDRFYDIFQHLSAIEVSKLKLGIPDQVVEIENTIHDIQRQSQLDSTFESAETEEQIEKRLMLAKLNDH